MKKLLLPWLLSLCLAFALGYLLPHARNRPPTTGPEPSPEFLDELAAIHQRELPRLYEIERQKKAAQAEGDEGEVERLEAERLKINLRRRLAEDDLRERRGRPPVRRD